MRERALVLGAGGLTGVAWELGLLAGLATDGVDLTGADLTIGTSAGSVVGALITSGQLKPGYQAQLGSPAGESAERIGLLSGTRMAWAMIASRNPAKARKRLGRMALAARTMPEADRRAMIAARLPSHEWPPGQLRVTAVDARSGEFTVFDSGSGVGLVDAVCASCAVPGVWPPVTIGGRRFMDGGMRSGTNADLAAGYGRVVIIAPLAYGIGRMPGVESQLSDLKQARTRVVMIEPDAAAAKAIGRNVLDPARRAAAARAGYEQAASVTGQVADIWLAVPGPEPSPA